ncbi:hypothetical protein GB937_008542, partial [Aspergillus fischeri]
RSQENLITSHDWCGCERYLTDLQNFLRFSASSNDRDTGGAIKTNTYDDKVHGRGWGLDESERKNMMGKDIWGSLAPDCMCVVCNITVRGWLQLEMRFSYLPSGRGLGIKIRASLDEKIGVGGLSEVRDFGMHFTPYVPATARYLQAYSLGRQGPRVLSVLKEREEEKIRQNAVPHMALLVLRDDAPLISFQFPPPGSPSWCSNL